MIIILASNEGGGGNRELNAPEGLTVSDFVRQHMPSFNNDRHQVSVNRKQVGPNTILTDMDHVAIMPKKVGGGQ